MTELMVSLLLTDEEGTQTRFWPRYRLVLAWSARGGELKMFGPFNMN